MNLRALSRYVIVLLVLFISLALGGCQALPQSIFPAPSATSSPTPEPTYTPAPVPTSTVALPTTIPLPTASPIAIIPDMVSRLVQVKQLGQGWLTGAPLYTPDGRWLLVPSTTGVYRYDTGTYQDISALTSDAASAPVILSPDGKTLVVGGRRVALSASANGKSISVSKLADLPLPTGLSESDTVHAASLSDDGRLLVMAYTNHKVSGWWLPNNQLLYSVPGETIAISHDMLFLAARVDRQSGPRILVYNAQTGMLLRDWPGERAAFLPDGRLAVEASSILRLYEPATGRSVKSIDGRFAAFSLDGKTAAVLMTSELRLLQLADGKELAKLDGDFKGVDEAVLRFASDGLTLAGITRSVALNSGQDATLSLWRAADGALLAQTPASDFSFSPDGRSLAVTSEQDESVQIFNTADGSPLASLGSFSSPVTALAFLADGKRLAAATYGSLRSPLLIYQIEDGRLARSIPTNINAPDYGLAVSPDGETVALGSQFWRAADGEQIPDLTAKMIAHFPFASHSMAFSPDGARVATGGLSGRLQVWDITGQNLSMEQTVCAGIVSSLAFSPEGKNLALACADVQGVGEASVQVWQLDSKGQRLLELKADPGHNLSRVAYSPDGRFLAAAGSQVKIWHTGDGKPMLTLALAGDVVQSMAVSPDGQILALGGKDGAVTLWNAADGSKLAVLPGSWSNLARGLAFSPDGHLLAVGQEDGSVRLWGVK